MRRMTSWRSGGVLFIAIAYLTSDEIPFAVAVLFALTWAFILACVGYANFREEPRTPGTVLLRVDEEGIYFGTPPSQHVPWSRVTHIELHGADPVGSGAGAGVTVSMISLENGEPTADGGSETRSVTDVRHRRIRAVIASVAPHVPVRDVD